jgi:hypothetical protein
MKIETEISNNILLEHELKACGIDIDVPVVIDINGEEEECQTLENALKKIDQQIADAKKELFEKWKTIGQIAKNAVYEKKYNDSPCLGNILFLHNVKKSHIFSLFFDELKEISKSIEMMFSKDISIIDHELVEKYNDVFLEIRILHILVMREIYRKKILKKYMSLNKIASISGPWANLDLPMQERVYPWAPEEEEYQQQRTTAKQKQSRYNPEYSAFGTYYEWVELRNNPYKFGDWSESPYPGREQIRLA